MHHPWGGHTMTATHTLTRHRDIQNWVTDRKGLPAIARVRDRFGEMRARLAIKLDRRKGKPSTSLDDGISPVAWNAWLAELDRQGLALKVSTEDDYEFVERKELN